jgi:hypothetical protein
MHQLTVFGQTYYLTFGTRHDSAEHLIGGIIARWGNDLDLGTTPAAVRHRASLLMRRLGVATS